MDYGLQSGLQCIRSTAKVFFPLHMRVGQMWCQFVRLGFADGRYNKTVQAIRGLPGGHAGTPAAAWSRFYRCGSCGLLLPTGVAAVRHIRDAHNPDDFCYRGRITEENAFKSVDRLASQRCPADSVMQPPVSVALEQSSWQGCDGENWLDGKDPFAQLALRQAGARVVSLDYFSALLSFLGVMAAHVVTRPTEGDGCRPPWGISVRDWGNLFVACVPRSARAMCPQWWGAYPRFVFTRTRWWLRRCS